MAKRFEDQVAWITGGGSGIGRALALELARQGAHVAVSGRRRDRLGQVAAEVEALGRRGLALPCDVTSDEELGAAAREVVAQLGRMDVTVANAGFAVGGSIEKVTAEQWRRQLDVNVVGLALTAKHALPALRETKGRIGLVGSVAGFLAIPKNGAYCASKFAVRAIAQTLSMELKGSGVSCTGLHPGFVESEINQVDNDGVVHADRKDTRPAGLLWPTDKAARVMVGALYRRKTEYVFTGHGRIGAFAGMHFPGMVRFAIGR